jgi:hypothetical protein
MGALTGTLSAGFWRGAPDKRHLTTDHDEEPQQSPEAMGEQLFGALFPGKILRLYERSLDILEGDPEAGLRIKLMFDPSDPNLAALQVLPWELLRQPGTPDFLALSRRRPFVRYLEIPRPVYAASWPSPLRIVVMGSSPHCEELDALDLVRELRNLREAAGSVKGIEIVTPESPTLTALRKTLKEKPCHAFHFMGHGGEIDGQAERVLFFEDEDGLALPIRGSDLANTLVHFPTLRLVVLNACESAAVPGEAPGMRFNPFAGVATSLVLGGIPAVIAMQHPISDESAIVFSRAFYQSLVARDPVDAAVAEGRQAVHSKIPAEAEWATPVLFMRTPTGELFPEEDVSAKPQQKPERRIKMHEQQIDLRGHWKGSWENVVKSKKGEELIHVKSQEDGTIKGQFFDTSEHLVTMEFEGEFRFSHLFVWYWAPAGQKIMQDGCCCLTLQDDGSLKGYYSDFSGCGTYELRLDQPR